MTSYIKVLACPDVGMSWVSFLSGYDWSELSLLATWLVGRGLYCAACVHWSGPWLITRQLYRHSQCTYSTSVHTDTPEVPTSWGWGRNFTVSCWVRSLRLHKIGHKTLMIRAGIFLAWELTLQSWAQHNWNTGTSINFAVKYLKHHTIQYGHHEQVTKMEKN